MRKLLLLMVLACSLLAEPQLSFASDSANPQLSAQEIESTVEQVSNVLAKNYVYPEVALKMNTYLVQQLEAGKYNRVRTLKELFGALEADLKQVSNDGHIGLLLADEAADRSSVIVPTNDSQLEMVTEMIAAETRPAIAYLQINTFSGHQKTRENLIEAMDRVLASDVLIIDLRNNHGGDPNNVALLTSYFLEENTVLWSIFDRENKQVIELRSVKNEKRYLGDLLILTSHETYSAAEAFAYTMKHAGRATIIGETTGGGAHLIDMIRVNDQLDMRVPVARAYNHVTKTNWERVGVIPHIMVNATEAKSAAIVYAKSESRR